MAIAGFYWLIEGALAGCSRPGGVGREGAGYGGRGEWGAPDPRESSANQMTQLENDLDWLRAQGVGAILSLT